MCGTYVSWLTSQFAEFLPRHRRAQGGLAHGFHACFLAYGFGTLRLLKPDEEEMAFRLLLDVKDIPWPPVWQNDPLLRINSGCTHGGIVPHAVTLVKFRPMHGDGFY